MYRTRQIRIRKGHKLWEYGRELCERSALLYNRANFLMRQYATAVRALEEMKPLRENQMQVYLLVRKVTRFSRYEPKGAWLTYEQLDHVLKMTDDEAYRSLPAQANQQILRRLLRDYNSFFKAQKKYQQHPEQFTGRPKLPGYRKKGSLATAVLTNQICRIREGRYLKFPGTKDRLDIGKPVHYDHLPGGKGIWSVSLKEVRIKPGAGDLVVEVVLECRMEGMEGTETAGRMPVRETGVRGAGLTGLSQEELRQRLGESRGQGEGFRAAAIDPGVDNLCAVTNNFGAKPFLIKGGVVKSENRYYNKKLAELKAQAMRCNKKHSTGRIVRLTARRNRIIKDLMHKASRKVADWAEENKADVVILGHNIFQKQKISTGHVNNQTFVQIPHSVFAGMLRYKLEEKGIAMLETEESYTSKADFLAGDKMPVYGKEKGQKKEKEKKGERQSTPVTFSGKRVRRGLYRHADGTGSNADINGAANILRKVFPNVTEWDRGVVDTPYVVRIA